METCGIDERDLAHTYYTHDGLAAEGRTHHLVKLCRHSEEERAVDLVDLHSGINIEHLMHRGFRAFSYVELLGIHLDLGVLHDTAQEEYDSKEQSYLYGYGEVEYDCEEECHREHRYVALGVVEYSPYGTPSAHVVSHDYEHSRET